MNWLARFVRDRQLVIASLICRQNREAMLRNFPMP